MRKINLYRFKQFKQLLVSWYLLLTAQSTDTNTVARTRIHNKQSLSVIMK